MAMEDLLENLQNFDMDQLNDFNNVGSWPIAVKIILWSLAFVGCLALGYFLHVTNLQGELSGVQNEEGQLRTSYEDKFFEAAHLESYREQQREMQESFNTILQQLPSDTEIPGLLEDINQVGIENGLSFRNIDLQPEVQHEFYIEKPITIVVSGGYHDLGSFVSDVADLSRIVTLHDFQISPEGGRSGEPGSMLTMTIVAKTYRYNDEQG
jgi:type IV pilus assembly protein PilO